MPKSQSSFSMGILFQPGKFNAFVREVWSRFKELEGAIRDLERGSHRAQSRVDELSNSLGDFQRQLEEARSQLAAREEVKGDTLKQIEVGMEQFRLKLRSLQQALKLRDQSIDARDEEIQAMRASIQAREEALLGRLGERDHALEDRDAALSAAREELRSVQASAGQTREKMDQLQQLMELGESQADRRDELLKHAMDLIQSQAAALSGKMEEIDRRVLHSEDRWNEWKAQLGQLLESERAREEALQILLEESREAFKRWNPAPPAASASASGPAKDATQFVRFAFRERLEPWLEFKTKKQQKAFETYFNTHPPFSEGFSEGLAEVLLIKGRLRLKGATMEMPDPGTLWSELHDLLIRQSLAFPGTGEARRIIDAGPGAGLSLWYFLQTQPQAKLLAWEPRSEFREILQRNLELNSWEQVSLLPGDDPAAAFQEPADFLKWTLPGSPERLASLFRQPGFQTARLFAALAFDEPGTPAGLPPFLEMLAEAGLFYHFDHRDEPTLLQSGSPSVRDIRIWAGPPTPGQRGAEEANPGPIPPPGQ
jgi:predicted  nucleic acid-binding Zn-ribbon protein